MKKGLSLASLGSIVDFQHENKRDFIVNTVDLKVVPDADVLMLCITDKSHRKLRRFVMEITNYTLGQVASYTRVPYLLMARMMQGSPDEQKAILKTINARLHAEEGQRMVRTLIRPDDKVQYARAFLSDTYRPLDNWEVLQAVFPVLAEFKGKLIRQSCDLTDERMYIKFSYPEISGSLGKIVTRDKAKIDDIVEAGVIISNSEVGAGRLEIKPFILRLACLNGATVLSPVGKSINKIHKGVRLLVDTINDPRPQDKEFFQLIRDVLAETITNEKYFKGVFGEFRATKDISITDDHTALSKLLCRRFNLTEVEAGMTLDSLEGYTLFDLINAITLMSQGKKISYQRATELETLGGYMIQNSLTMGTIFADTTFEV